MTRIDLSSLDMDSYVDAIDIETIKRKLSDSKYSIIVNDLENIIKADRDAIISIYLSLSDRYSKEEKREIEKAFDYPKYRKQHCFMEHFKKLNIKSCPFCNNNYIYFYKKNAGQYNTLATLEHYYPKAKYPHLSLSFYNLIPSCSNCNCKFRGKSAYEGNILHPYYDDFNEKAQFTVAIDSLSIGKGIELSVALKSNDQRCIKSINRFELDRLYSQHVDIAKEIWNKAQMYNDSRIDELHNSFYKKLGYSKEDVKNMIFCNYISGDDINRRNHSKLTQDILRQFELV